MTQEQALPAGWVETTLGEVVQILDSERIPVNAEERGKRLANAKELFPYYGATGQVGYIDDYIFDGEAILLGEDAAPFLEFGEKKAYIANGKYWVNNHAHILRGLGGVENLFLCQQLNIVDYHSFVSGTTRLKLTQASLRGIPIKLAPRAEQQRIVSKIEELFSDLDAGEASLRKVQKLLATYRQSVLKAAVTGELTKDWREANRHQLESGKALLQRILQARREQWKGRGKYQEPQKLDIEGLPELPSEWSWAPIETLTTADKHSLKAGPFGSSLKKEVYVFNGYKVYGQEQVISGDCNYGDYFISEVKYKELESCRVQPYDILISLVGTIGKVLVLPENINPGIINPRLIKISPNRIMCNPYFFKYYFESAFLRSLYKLKAHGATMDILNLGIIKSLPYVICSLEEQHEAVSRIEAAFSQIDALENLCATEMKRSGNLRQAILKAAFSGQLMPQDPTDEPASVLLERIRAERQATPARRGRRRRAEEASEDAETVQEALW